MSHKQLRDTPHRLRHYIVSHTQRRMGAKFVEIVHRGPNMEGRAHLLTVEERKTRREDNRRMAEIRKTVRRRKRHGR